ncbi:ATP-NAD kinase family protein [Shewanella sp. SR43-4]|uniref:ATP-NAD kinase family protein n=1 Tax=Shewanella TaxID=22 RepID=UPI000C562051|nr:MULTISPECIES: ATP-NAD kinase family protein [Shewanella]NCQ46957.1 ATP-NAD kinase family protein [Shewanella frigidimarina]MBB1316762.1 ATP-NAD kinase family protein [Shewanella sp. SR43-4]NCO72871.1 ATP-NAD kinase family protein [Shewanella vesiculosa]NCP38575.1 ATP-NAD kinase family protein [Shewanella vesiculosa]NCP71291.1 ATP-NAD kinase family protein [Shewanella vesiculosa]
MKRFRLGIIINPLAGLGGSVGLKGSDGVANEALAKGAIPKAQQRMQQALDVILPFAEQIDIITASGDMGGLLCRQMGFSTQEVYRAIETRSAEKTSALDTQQAVKCLLEHQLDLLLFAGGDGTARDIYAVVDDSFPVLGVPAGVKIHSGVYGITPHASGVVVRMLLNGELVSLMSADVMDIDEVAFRQGIVKARRFGEMTVPAEPRYIQAVKMGGKEVDELVLADIAADIIESMDDELYIMGSGSTVAAVMEDLGLANTLLGVDVIQHKQIVAQDVTAQQLLTFITDKKTYPSVKLVITLIGGQGHILGRGNQQLSPDLIRQIEKDNILILATKTKLKALEGRPLIVDSGDPELDKALTGYYKIVTGYHDYVMYQVANPDLVEN